MIYWKLISEPWRKLFSTIDTLRAFRQEDTIPVAKVLGVTKANLSVGVDMYVYIYTHTYTPQNVEGYKYSC